MKIRPATLKEANEYVAKFHRHHKPTTGHKFSIKLVDNDGEIVGVAICGRPVSRYFDDGVTLEINRLCTNGERNACSMLYGACVRIAKNMGYDRVITYILASEDGASLKASNFICEGGSWRRSLDREKKRARQWRSKRKENEMGQKHCSSLRLWLDNHTVICYNIVMLGGATNA